MEGKYAVGLVRHRVYDALGGSNGGVSAKQTLRWTQPTVLADPRVLILDEATSNIDLQTELLVQQALRSIDCQSIAEQLLPDSID